MRRFAACAITLVTAAVSAQTPLSPLKPVLVIVGADQPFVDE